jgi:release factor glutamine methyltransferase
MPTLLEILKKTADFLAAKGVESPRLQAELLIGHALGLKRMELYLQFERMLTPAELDKIRPLVRRRSQREPLQYILGGTEFFHLMLKADRRALIPRPETERLLELVTTRLAAGPPATILDLGTGSGAIALGLAACWPGSLVTAVEASPEALALAGENAAAAGLDGRLQLLQSDWFSALAPAARFDLIIANPPYLTEAEVAEAAPEVRDHEPRLALTPGRDGLGALRTIIDSARGFLKPGGMLALETGIAQHGALLGQLTAAGYQDAESEKDYAGRDRFILARRG